MRSSPSRPATRSRVSIFWLMTNILMPTYSQKQSVVHLGFFIPVSSIVSGVLYPSAASWSSDKLLAEQSRLKINLVFSDIHLISLIQCSTQCISYLKLSWVKLSCQCKERLWMFLEMEMEITFCSWSSNISIMCNESCNNVIYRIPWSNQSGRWPLGKADYTSASLHTGQFQVSENQGSQPLKVDINFTLISFKSCNLLIYSRAANTYRWISLLQPCKRCFCLCRSRKKKSLINPDEIKPGWEDRKRRVTKPHIFHSLYIAPLPPESAHQEACLGCRCPGFWRRDYAGNPLQETQDKLRKHNHWWTWHKTRGGGGPHTVSCSLVLTTVVRLFLQRREEHAQAIMYCFLYQQQPL